MKLSWREVGRFSRYRKPSKFHLVLLEMQRSIGYQLVTIHANGWWTGHEWDALQWKKEDVVVDWSIIKEKYM